MIITISGMPGSGKTTVGKIIAEKLNYNFFSAGELRGKIALDRGLTLDELNRLGETDKTTDTTVDEYQKKLGQENDNFVIEGRLSWLFIPNSYKIFLDCDSKTAADRLIKSREQRPDESLPADPEKVRDIIEKRVQSDTKRYSAFYNVDYKDPKHYDLVLDTAELKSANQTADLVLKALRTRLDSQA